MTGREAALEVAHARNSTAAVAAGAADAAVAAAADAVVAAVAVAVAAEVAVAQTSFDGRGAVVPGASEDGLGADSKRSNLGESVGTELHLRKEYPINTKQIARRENWKRTN